MKRFVEGEDRRQGVPGLERIAGVLDLPGDPVDEAAPFERLAQSLAVIGPVGEKALLVALDQRFAQTGIVHIGRGHLGLTNEAALLVHRQMRLVTEIGLVALAGETSLGIARIDAAALIRTSDRAGDYGRVDQRAAFDDKAERVELAVDLGQQLRR